MSQKRREEAIRLTSQYGVDKTAEMMGITRETVRRYNRAEDSRRGKCQLIQNGTEQAEHQPGFENDPVLQRIAELYSPTELKLLAQGGLPMEYKHTPVHDFTGQEIRIGYLTDTHIGSIYTDYSYIREAREIFAQEGVDIVCHVGDVTEGMSHRPGHIYECSELGYDAQKERATELMGEFDFCPGYVIDGNHDRWYIKSNGAKIVKDMCDQLENWEFLGHDEGDIILGENVTLRLWHGEDGSSYAISYRLQKILESLSGGDKPDILLTGHVHKFGHFFIRNVHTVSCGCIQKQSKWMRGKKIEAHTGFGIIDVVVNEHGVGRFKNEFFPFYA